MSYVSVGPDVHSGCPPTTTLARAPTLVSEALSISMWPLSPKHESLNPVRYPVDPGQDCCPGLPSLRPV